MSGFYPYKKVGIHEFYCGQGFKVELALFNSHTSKYSRYKFCVYKTDDLNWLSLKWYVSILDLSWKNLISIIRVYFSDYKWVKLSEFALIA